MAARGTESKGVVFSKLQEVFPGSFWEDPDKILRIPLDENGSRVEIKVTLTAAKVNIGEDGPQSAFSIGVNTAPAERKVDKLNEEISKLTEPTDEEKQRVMDLLSALNI